MVSISSCNKSGVSLVVRFSCIPSSSRCRVLLSMQFFTCYSSLVSDANYCTVLEVTAQLYFMWSVWFIYFRQLVIFAGPFSVSYSRWKQAINSWTTSAVSQKGHRGNRDCTLGTGFRQVLRSLGFASKVWNPMYRNPIVSVLFLYFCHTRKKPRMFIWLLKCCCMASLFK